MSTRHLSFKFFLFVFHLFFIFKRKKKYKNCYPRPSTWNPRPSTPDIKMDSFAGKRFFLSPPPPPSFIFFFFLLLSQHSRRTREETLATQANLIWLQNVCPTVLMSPLCFVVLNQVQTALASMWPISNRKFTTWVDFRSQLQLIF